MENQNLIKRGSIFYYDLGATDGSVQSGTRPVMIVIAIGNMIFVDFEMLCCT